MTRATARCQRPVAGSPFTQAQGDAARARTLSVRQLRLLSQPRSGQEPDGPEPAWRVQSGQRPGSRLSPIPPPFKSAKLQWNEANLDKWLTNPAAMVPGNMMMFPGSAMRRDRQHLIAYLKTLK
jgi:cytochrome c